MKRILLVVICLFMPLTLEATPSSPVPITGPGITGHLERFEAFPSNHVAPRNVDVWLPPGYEKNPDKRYPVLYMHDGQNVFDPATSYTKIDWGVDEAMTRLIQTGQAREAIVVGIWNTPRRMHEYMPAKAIEGASFILNLGDAPMSPSDLSSDAYLRFLAKELKPFVDARYRTLTGPQDTSVMGSSMGGLISAYAVAEYPDVFGGAGCVSTHWPAGQGIMIDYLAKELPPPGRHRWYFDYGSAGIDVPYAPYQHRVDALMRSSGHAAGKDWISRSFVGADHNEAAWRERVEVPLTFLLSP
jgi:predicted alpha/beta superfamily hydrolase